LHPQCVELAEEAVERGQLLADAMEWRMEAAPLGQLRPLLRDIRHPHVAFAESPPFPPEEIVVGAVELAAGTATIGFPQRII
jgi:hypothetical protein